MANQKYDYLTEMMATGRFNWNSDHIVAMLLKDATFRAADKRLSEVLARPGAVHQGTSEISARSLSPANEAIGNPATFPTVSRAIAYQVLLVKDEGTGDPAMVAYYDEDDEAQSIVIQNNGTLIVRPIDTAQAQSPAGIWFKF